MITLHDFAASANCFKVRMLLSQLETPYERDPGGHLRRGLTDGRVSRR